MDCFISYRFGFLRPGIPNSWTIKTQSIVDKTMLWEDTKKQVFWEYHDGVCDDRELEECTTLVNCLNVRNKNKRTFYVKPNISDTKSIKHASLAIEHGCQLLTCMQWSYYPMASYNHKIRHELRSTIRKRTGVRFIGNPSNRMGVLTHAMKAWGSSFSIHDGLKMMDYNDAIMNSAWCLQPHGVGPRHATYECMMLGTPNIIPENSYIKDDVRTCNVIYVDELPTNVVFNKELSLKCIETYETLMTPNAIVSSVIKSIEEYL